MNIIITKKQLNLIEQAQEGGETSADICDANIGKGVGDLGNWKSMDENTRKRVLDKINNNIKTSINDSISKYSQWFKNPQTLKKFKNNEMGAVRGIDGFLGSIKNIKLHWRGPNNRNTVIAWVSGNNMNTINYNISMIHDGNTFIGPTIFETTKHEIGHLIDYYFKSKGVKTYIMTNNFTTQEEYQSNYIINDKDQYTRLNVFREYVNAGPADDAETLLKKFLDKVKEGTISSEKYNFRGVAMTGMNKKNDTQAANNVYRMLHNSIYYNNKPSMNIEQLFATFSFNKNNNIYVGFDLISRLNFTSKAPIANKKFYYLELSPK